MPASASACRPRRAGDHGDGVFELVSANATHNTRRDLKLGAARAAGRQSGGTAGYSGANPLVRKFYWLSGKEGRRV